MMTTREDERNSPRTAASPAVEAHYRLPGQPVLGDGRRQITLLFGGLTTTHERLIEGAWEGVGYRARALSIPDNDALAIGREVKQGKIESPSLPSPTEDQQTIEERLKSLGYL